MSLHRVDQTQNGAPVMAAATYASELAARTLPKHRMPDAGVSANKAKSGIPAFGYPVPYALSTVVFLIYGYLAMLLS